MLFLAFGLDVVIPLGLRPLGLQRFFFSPPEAKTSPFAVLIDKYPNRKKITRLPPTKEFQQ